MCATMVTWQAVAPLPTTQERLEALEPTFTPAPIAVREREGAKQILAVDPRSAAPTCSWASPIHLGSKERKGEAIAEFRQALDRTPRLVQVRFFLRTFTSAWGARQGA